MTKLNKDIHLTAEFVTFLRAGLYGQILFENALTRLGSKLLPENYLDATHRAFDRLDEWSSDLLKGLPIFAVSWSEPETFDAISAMNFMKDLKRDLTLITPKVDLALQSADLVEDHEARHLLVAALVRSAAVRGAYTETLYATYTDLGALDLAQPISTELEAAREYARITNVILETFTSTPFPDEPLCEKLRREASLTPGDFRSQIHDTTVLLNVYRKEFTFELAEIPPEEAAEWIAERIPAVAAGHWRAYGFSAQEFLVWQGLGILAAPLAANWRRATFSPHEAIEWIREGIAPATALAWGNAGFQPARAAALLRRGVTEPPKTSRADDD